MPASFFSQPRIAGKYFHSFRYFLLSISLMLFILLSQGAVGDVFAQTVNPQTHQQHQAALLTQKGHEQLNLGQAEAALQTWQSATKIYRKLQNIEGVTGSLINQGLALQALGMYPRACKTLTQALNLEDWICENAIQLKQTSEETTRLLTKVVQSKPVLSLTVTGLGNLGDVLRLIGKPDESEIVLQQALSMAKRLAPNSNINKLLLSLANTEHILYNRARDRYQTTEEPTSRAKEIILAPDKFSLALKLYQQVTGSSSAGEKQSDTALQAQLNILSLCLDLEQWLVSEALRDVPALVALQSQTQAQIPPILKQLLAAQFSQLPALQSIYARLNLANSLIKISQSAELNQLLLQEEKPPILVALQLTESAVAVAQRLNNERAESYTLGTMGEIYTLQGQPELAKPYFEHALSLAQSIGAWDIAYQWQQKLGRLYQLEGNLDKAIKAYEASVNSLEQVRGDILSGNPDFQFSFKEKVEPIYREYMRLLLAAPQPNFEQVIQTNEQLQLAELENFLQCGRLNLVSLEEIQVNSPPAVIHIIDLEDRLEVIVRSRDHSLHHYTPDFKLVKLNVDNLLFNLQDPKFVSTDEPIILSYSQALYSLLIAPIKQYLPKEGTLVFVLDSSLQSLPITMLHDGTNYLLKQYSISLTLGSQLRQPKALEHRHSRALIAGISKQSPSFNSANAPINLAPLPEVETEIADIQESIASSVELLNEEFTSVRLQQEIDTGTFPVVHITTHGQFSSDPEQTVILAWNKAINVRELNSLFRGRQGQQDGIEMLVLSACQTAKGNKRSALGIAGVAAQAGARSTVATLWRVEAQSTAQLMGEFYKGLRNGISKAEALRQAQLKLLEKPEYQHPFYWAGFILVGSWL